MQRPARSRARQQVTEAEPAAEMGEFGSADPAVEREDFAAWFRRTCRRTVLRSRASSRATRCWLQPRSINPMMACWCDMLRWFDMPQHRGVDFVPPRSLLTDRSQFRIGVVGHVVLDERANAARQSGNAVDLDCGDSSAWGGHSCPLCIG